MVSTDGHSFGWAAVKSGEAGPYWIGVASVGPMSTVDGERCDEMAASPQQIAELVIDLKRLGTA